MNAQQVVMSPIGYLLREGVRNNTLILATGLVAMLLALACAFAAKKQGYLIFTAFFSMAPGLVAMTRIMVYTGRFLQMSISQEPHKPSEFVDVVGGGLSAGFWGVVLTVLPVICCLIGLARFNQQSVTVEENRR